MIIDPSQFNLATYKASDAVGMPLYIYMELMGNFFQYNNIFQYIF